MTQQAASSQADPGRLILNVVSVILTCGTIAGVIVLAGFHAFVVPYIVTVFEDFDAELPVLTVMVVQTPFWLSIAAGAAFAAILIAKECLIPSPAVRIIIDFCITLLLIVTAAVVIVALFLPMIILMKSVM